jgi:hypothetical protein
MKKTYEAWAEIKDGVWSNLAFATTETIQEHKTRGLLASDSRLLHRVEADTWEEACAVHHLKMGWKPYDPGKPAPCPRNCGSTYYPEGSGECPNCGKVR